MSDLGNKKIMAANITYYMDRKGITRTQLCDDLGFTYSTVSEWINARKYPRIDKIELMANYFGITKADLVESQTYYIEQETAKKVQEIYADPEARILLDAKRDLSPEDLEAVINIIKSLKEKK